MVRVLNRNLDIARRTAVDVGGDPVDPPDKTRAAEEADILICATLASHYRVGADIVRERGRPLYIVDLSPFGNVDPEVGSAPEAVLVDGGIRSAVEENMEVQRRAVPGVERIIYEELGGIEIS
ncbi:MAG: hypothetical protein GXO65_04845 [Euryarchaeota archaeon]|nr:hypothetical protein [Euryarchaeota archaeon]